MDCNRNKPETGKNIKDIVLLYPVFEKLKQERPDSRGYVLVRTEPEYQAHGFKSLGINYRKVSDSASLETRIQKGDLGVFTGPKPGNIEFAPYLKCASEKQPAITDIDIWQFLAAVKAKHFFIFDNQGGITVVLEQDGNLKRLKTTGYVLAVKPESLGKEGLKPELYARGE